ncbi:cytochrome o ubiquinol oxidase subunit III [Buchnera aphidicola]|uniref:Cytochrome bo(3) ubiquinol oxidase subunit 3 n=1 Tax=Buchnera aphidicola subsp. Rhopalosiphum maidis TaxID=118109 RepID=A0A3G2I5C0_BUCRM|nr:cytochrome o ubiquinol oxidase subunit III [Buchnera aphidicola]AYN24616.1 cytochrome o ubiquinol oxidase subunit III [Buchnera aphidicola (Rhopalosiphum maidis)]
MIKEKIRNNKLFGLWIYLMSDCIIFAVLFAVYAIFSSNFSTNFINHKIFNLSYVFFETFILLLSSLSCGMLTIQKNKKNIKIIYFYLFVTFFLGLSFLLMEINEFHELILEKFSPSQHAFFSIFFTLVGVHGAHVFLGLIFILSILYQLFNLGITETIRIRILCFSLFWHFLDIIWICVFTFVYLNGVI